METNVAKDGDELAVELSRDGIASDARDIKTKFLESESICSENIVMNSNPETEGLESRGDDDDRNDALRSQQTRPTVIVPNPTIVRSASVPCTGGELPSVSVFAPDSSSTLALVSESETRSTSASLSLRWAQSPDSIIERLRFINAEHLRVLCRSYITSLVNCPELELMLKEDDTNSVASSNRKAGRRTRTFSLSSTSKKAKPLGQCNVGAIFGNPLTQEGIAQITQLLDFLSQEENLKTEGLFRKSGNIARQRELKVLLDTGSDLSLSEGRQNFSAHDCANVLKSFLGELPEPLLQEKYYGAHCQVPELSDAPVHPGVKRNTKKCTALQLLFLLLPRESYLLLRSLLRFLALVASHADSNRMTPSALGTLFAPHLLCPRSMTPTELQNAVALVSRSVEFMIVNVEALFTAPPELVQSAEMFLRRRNVGKAMETSFGSPFNNASDNLDSSTEGLLSPTNKRSKRHRRGSTGERHINIFGFGSDSARGRHPSSPATTPPAGPPESPAPVDPMLHFVDQKNSQAAEEGCTRKALQELYANIQSMPEGPKKRRYIKMMQKNHGLGTPIPAADETPEDNESPPKDDRRGRKHSRSRSFGEALGNFKRALSRGRHQRSRSSSRNRPAAGRRNGAAEQDTEKDAAGPAGVGDVENEKFSPPERDESPPQKTHRSNDGGSAIGPWVHRQHSKAVAGTTLSPIAMSPMDHHAHTPVIAAAAASPVSRKHTSSLTGGNSSTPKIPTNAVRVLPDRQSQRASALPSSVSSLRHVASSSTAPLSPTAKPLKPTTNFSDKLLSLSEQSKTTNGTPHGKSGTVLHRGPNVHSGMERFRSPLPSKFALSVAQSQQDLVTDVVLADDEARV